MSNRRVLITGRNGFTGRYLANALAAKGWEVWGLGQADGTPDDPTFLSADLTDPAALLGVIKEVRPSAVVHLAALAFVGHGNVEEFYKVNLIGTRNLLEALSAADLDLQRVVLASSANIYGNAGGGALSEETVPAPENDYAVSKLAMEYAAKLFSGQLPISIARPFNYTGRGQNEKFLLPKIAAHFRARATKIELGNLEVARDFSDVRDVAEAYVALLDEVPSGSVVNICSGHATRLQDIIETCADISGHTVEVTTNPAFQRANEISVLCGDPSRLASLSGYRPRYTLRETLAWMLED
ncbi:MAG: GDP-mannose 4,6-dehydratase [Pseudomonadota bacterium]